MAEDTRTEEEKQSEEEAAAAAKAKADGELGDAGKRAIDAERKARQVAEKRAKELEAKVKEAEDAEKTEVEKLQGQVADLTKRAEASEAKATRFEVAATKGLSLAQARRLVGATQEELEADADSMRAELGLDKEEEQGKEEEGTSTGRPQERLKAGASNESDEEPDAGKLADSILSSSF